MGKVKSLRICHVNVRSILSTGRLLELEVLCYVNDVDVLCVTETWLSPQRIKEGASLLNIPGYLPPFRCDRLHKRGGGVAVFVRRGLHVSPMPLSPGLEALGIVLHLPKNKKLNVISVYRPPRPRIVSMVPVKNCCEANRSVVDRVITRTRVGLRVVHHGTCTQSSHLSSFFFFF